jgi:hypothetical protein
MVCAFAPWGDVDFVFRHVEQRLRQLSVFQKISEPKTNSLSSRVRVCSQCEIHFRRSLTTPHHLEMPLALSVTQFLASRAMPYAKFPRDPAISCQ